MNKVFTFLAAVLLTASTFLPQQASAQVPDKMSYQAVVRDSGDNLITSQPVGMQISILQGSTSGSAVYVETQTPVTNVNGLVTLEIGTGTTSDDFSTIDWSAGPYFTKTETDPTGGINYTITGTSQLLSVPYALYAKNGLPTNGTEGQVLTVNGSGDAEWTNASIGEMFYADADGDGYGDINNKVLANDMPTGYVSNNTDCDDNDVTINNTNTVWYLDSDNDGYAASTIVQCNPGTGYTTTVLPLGDCNDGDPTINPIATEIAGDLIDNNCDGQIDEAEIGQYIEGGVVFWVDPTDNYKGLVCAIEDQALDTEWSNGSDITTGAIETVIGTGEANTNTIITEQGPGTYAASIARAYTGGGFTDWFLPSKDELNEMYINRVVIDAAAMANGGTAFNLSSITFYSSSTEFSSEEAWTHQFANGNQFPYYKFFGHDVRAVRAF